MSGSLKQATPTRANLSTIDELSLLLHKKLRVKVAAPSRIADLF